MPETHEEIAMGARRVHDDSTLRGCGLTLAHGAIGVLAARATSREEFVDLVRQVETARHVRRVHIQRQAVQVAERCVHVNQTQRADLPLRNLTRNETA